MGQGISWERRRPRDRSFGNGELEPALELVHSLEWRKKRKDSPVASPDSGTLAGPV